MPTDVNTPRGLRDRAWVARVVRQIQDGEELEECYKRLFHEYAPAIRRRLLCWGCRETEVEDLVQDIFVRVYLGIGSFRLDSTFDTWIFHVMTNVWKNALRKKGSNKPEAHWTSLDHALEPGEDSKAVLPEPAAPDTPLDATLAKEIRRRLGEALKELPPRTQRYLRFRSFGYTNEEIAQAHGVSVANVKKQVERGRKRLRDLGPMVELFGLSVLLILLLP